MNKTDQNKTCQTIAVEGTGEQSSTTGCGGERKSPQDYFRKGMEDAGKRAEQYAPKFKEEVEAVLQEVAYGVGFVPGFLGAFVKEFLPEHVTESVQEGVSKGEEQARSMVQKMKTPSSASQEADKYAPPTEA